MKAKKLWVFAIAFCMVLCMMPVGVFATEEKNEECICSVSCSEQDVNEDCEVCFQDFKQCVKAKQRKAASTEEKTSDTTTEKKEETTTKTTKKQEVTTKTTTEKREEIAETTEKKEGTTEQTTEKKEETTKPTTEKKEETTKPTTEKKEETTEPTTEKQEDTTEKEEESDDIKVDVNETNFPDEAFRNWIVKNISGADNKGLTAEEIEAVKEISISGQGVKSLEGIKNFKNLESLDCTNNNLTTLDLTGLDALKTVKATGQESTATAIEKEDGWRVDMEGVVGRNNVGKVKFVEDSLPEDFAYTYGVLIIPRDSIPETVKYNYETGASQNLEVTLTLNKKPLEPSIDVNETNFPDEAFRNWIIEQDYGKDKVLTPEEIAKVVSINVSGKGIKSLKGIKNFKNLEKLDCSKNNLTTLDLTGLDALKTVNASGQEAIASVVEEKDGWKLDMKEIVKEGDVKNITFADGALPDNAQYKDGVVIFSTTPEISTLTYQYKTGADKDLEVKLALTKKALPDPVYVITMSTKTLDFGEKCIGIDPSEQSFKITNNSDEAIDIKVVSTSKESSYDISPINGLKDGKLEAGKIATVKVQPKPGRKVGEYKEEFNIQVNGEQAKTFSASFKVVEHSGGVANCVDKAVCTKCKNSYGSVDASKHKDIVKVDAKAATHTSEGNIAYWYCRGCKKYFKNNNGKVGEQIDSSKLVIAKTTAHTANGSGWSRDDNSHWQVCTCGAQINKASHSLVWKVDRQATATQNGYGHYECSVCGYKRASVTIYATGTTATRVTATTRSTVQTTTATTRASLLSKIIPTTGDDSHIALWFGVLVICAVAFLGVLGRYLSKRR